MALLALALALRLAALGSIPSVVIHDECDNLVNVFQILHGKGPGPFGLDWKPQPAFSVYVQSVFVRFHPSLAGLRLPSALFSVAALVPFYLLARAAVAAPVALLGTLLLATDIWYLHFSRTGWENVYTCLFLAAAAVLLRRALQSGRLAWFALAGVAAALGAYGYVAGRVVLPTILAAALLATLRPHIARRRIVLGTVLASLVAAALFAPQIPAIVSNWEYFQTRTRYVSLLAGDNAARSPAEKASLVARSFGHKFAQLFASDVPAHFERGDRYLRFRGGAFVRATAALLGAGMVVSVLWWSETWLWWVFFLVPFFLTQALTRGSLNGARGVIFVPILYLFVTLAVQAIWTLAARLHRSLPALVVAGAIAVSVGASWEYFAWVRSPAVVATLAPWIPASEFPEWRRFVFDWVGRHEGFFNLHMWEEEKRWRPHPMPDAP